MKRRLFLTTAGLTGVGISSGIAATGQLLFADAPWRVHPELTEEMVPHLDDFASNLRIGLQEHAGDLKAVKNIVAPKKILRKNTARDGYLLVYENLNGKYIVLTKNEKGYKTAIYNNVEDSNVKKLVG